MEKNYEDIQEEFWKPEIEGDFVCGILARVQHNAGQNKSNLYSLKKEDGNIVNVWGSTVLDDKMAVINQGDDIKIIYEGKVKPEKGKAYHNYKVQREVSEEMKGGEE